MDYNNQDTEETTPLTYNEEEVPSAETEEEMPAAETEEETPTAETEEETPTAEIEEEIPPAETEEETPTVEIEEEIPPATTEEEMPMAETEEEMPAAETEEETPLATLSPEDLEPPRETGHVKWFNNVRSYGFIEREGADDVFVHASNINHQPQSLNENDLVEFTVVSSEKGLSAEDVTIVREAPNF